MATENETVVVALQQMRQAYKFDSDKSDPIQTKFAPLEQVVAQYHDEAAKERVLHARSLVVKSGIAKRRKR